MPADVDARRRCSVSENSDDVARPHFDEQHPFVRRQVMRFARLAQLVLRTPAASPVSGRLAMIADRRVRRFVNELQRGGVGLDPVHAQLGRSQHARHQRRHDDRDDEERRDLDAFGPLDDVDDRRVDEDQRSAAGSRASARRRARAASVTASAADPISTSTPVAYAPPCDVDVGIEAAS